MLAVLCFEIAVVSEGTHPHMIRQHRAEMNLVTAKAAVQDRHLDALAAPTGRVPRRNAHVRQQPGARRRLVSSAGRGESGCQEEGKKSQPARSASKALDGGRSIMARALRRGEGTYQSTRARMRETRAGVGQTAGIRPPLQSCSGLVASSQCDGYKDDAGRSAWHLRPTFRGVRGCHLLNTNSLVFSSAERMFS